MPQYEHVHMYYYNALWRKIYPPPPYVENNYFATSEFLGDGQNKNNGHFYHFEESMIVRNFQDV
jgi:hypothetical protein